MNNIFLGLGSNVGDRYAHLEACFDRLINSPDIMVRKVSSIYETEPVGYRSQKNFLNMAMKIEHYGSPFTLLRTIKAIERSMGRSTPFRWGPRNIDIDILYYGELIVRTNTLCIPHQEIRKRMFVLQPMAEIAPEFHCPISGQNMIELCNDCTDANVVNKYSVYGQETLPLGMNSL